MHAYPHYPTRETLNLDGIWQFALVGERIRLADFTPGSVTCNEVAAVPGVFDTSIARRNVRGLAIYRRTFENLAPGRTRLTLGGMGLYGRVFVDGQELGRYIHPYSETSYDFELADRKRHTLEIAVDNRYDAHEFPYFLPGYDFYAFGGIYRSVTLQKLPAASIERAAVFTLDPLHGLVRIRIGFSGATPRPTVIGLGFDDQTPEIRELTPDADGTAEFIATVPAPQPWSPESPHLHLLRIQYGDDAIVERFGLRTVQTAGEKILLNGHELYLCGVNRHESHPEFGPVQNYQLLLDDLLAARKLGANFIRTVHYQQDPAFFDLCDEMGFLVWEETIGWGLSEEWIKPENIDRYSPHNQQMVRRNINNPSILFWGFLNECATETPATREFYRALIADIKAVDPSRLVSYAANRGTADQCMDLCDVLSINAYPGWIFDIDERDPKYATEPIQRHMDRLAAWCSTGPRAEKPLIVTEIGACGTYGFHDFSGAPWSEEFQRDFMAEACRAIFANPRYTGITLWQFFDTKSYQVGPIRCKPRGVNQAGLLDEYRRPKLAFEAVREAFLRQLGQE